MASSPISPPPLASPNPLSSPNVPSPIPNSPIPSSPSFSPRPTPPVRRASTSSVTIPIPGKSILKKPPPPPTGLLSRITSGISVNGIGGMSMGGLGKFFGSGTGGNATSSVNSNLATIPEPPIDTVPSSTPPLNPALKRAHFILPHMAVVYPISSSAPPRTPTTQMEKKAVENRERERRRKVVSGDSTGSGGSAVSTTNQSESSGYTTPVNQDYRYGLSTDSLPTPIGVSGAGWWNMDKVGAFYKECCAASDELPDPAISKALLRYSTSAAASTSLTTLSTNPNSTNNALTPITANPNPISALPSSMSASAPRTLDLTGISLSLTQAEILADVLSIEWGLRTLILCESNLDVIILKPILHALLLNNTLIYLSVASNSGLGRSSKNSVAGGGGGLNFSGGFGSLKGAVSGGAVTGWVVLEAYLSKSRLKVLDLSMNVLDKKAMESVVRGALGSLGDDSTLSSSRSPSTESLSTITEPHDSHSHSYSPSPSVVSLTLDSTTFKSSAALDVLARAVRTSPSLRTLSLRNCRIGAMGSRGGIAVSLMVRDWPDSVPGSTGPSGNGSGNASGSNSSSVSVSMLNPSSSTPVNTSHPQSTTSIQRLRRPAALTNLFDSVSSPPVTSTPTTNPAFQSLSFSKTPLSAKPSPSAPLQKPLLPPPRHPVNSNMELKPNYLPPPAAHPLSHSSNLPPPPPIHPTKIPPQTTYTPYVPRSKRAVLGAAPGTESVPPTPTTPSGPLTPMKSATPYTHTPITPTLTTVSRGGVTALTSTNDSNNLSSDIASNHAIDSNSNSLNPNVINAITHNHGGATLGAQPMPPSVAALNSASAALLTQVRALDALPRIGSLRVLDLRGNELRNHITYLAQVLKRNRTLKSLNLQDNKLDPKALVVIAEALKYNAALEELDLGRNPCCGVVGGVGVASGGDPTLTRSSTVSSTNSTSSSSSSIRSYASSYTPSMSTPPSSTTSFVSYKPNPPSSASLTTAHTQPRSQLYSNPHPSTTGSASSSHPSSAPPQAQPNLGLEGLHALRLALALNTTLTRLSLSATHLGDAGAIALAEWMGEYRGLRWLDLTRNSAAEVNSRSLGPSGVNGSGLGGLGQAGVMALAQGVKVNRTLRCLDVEVPPGVEGYAKLSREILNTCIRNVEASAREQAEQAERGGEDREQLDGWNITKDPVHRARDCTEDLKKYLKIVSSTNSAASITSTTFSSPAASDKSLSPSPHPHANADVETLLQRSKSALDDLMNVISGLLEDTSESSFDGSAKEAKMQEVLELSDELGALVANVEEVTRKNNAQELVLNENNEFQGMSGGKEITNEAVDVPGAEGKESGRTSVPGKEKPSLRVEVPLNSSTPSVAFSSSSISASSTLSDSTVSGSGPTFTITDSPTPSPPPSTSPRTSSPIPPVQASDASGAYEERDVLIPTSDKGKARAPPEPERHEPVLSPTAVLLRNGVRGASSLGLIGSPLSSLGMGMGLGDDGLSESEGEGEIEDEYEDAVDRAGGDEGENGDEEAEAGVRSRSWVAEEGEVFRKGNVLLGPEEMEGEYNGEELRRELLEAMVERPAPRSLRIDDPDDYGSVLTPSTTSPSVGGSALSTPLSPPHSSAVLPTSSLHSTPSLSSSPSISSSPSTPLASRLEHDLQLTSPSSLMPSRSGGTTPTQETNASSAAGVALSSSFAMVRPYVPRTRSSFSGMSSNQSQGKMIGG
ncbi:hypothetical protein C8J55DRAFT_606423 [Lentinula edodes]|uniref:RNI-like protein n=1 Tax=Lentinula lateritia TaxID=40482 RepID=A0A9W9ABC7_9AGAR|nr:hypothetical protein C8J55DRAFT_606423 [Lentinula edodes]